MERISYTIGSVGDLRALAFLTLAEVVAAGRTKRRRIDADLANDTNSQRCHVVLLVRQVL